MSFDIPEEVESAPVAELLTRIRREGIHRPDEIDDTLDQLYHRGGIPRGSLTGWMAVDQLYTVAGSQWTLVTGIPGMGKSEWLDALMVNLAEEGDWHFGIYSPENHPIALHSAKILEKRVRKPFGIGVRERISVLELVEAEHWMHERFTWIKPVSDAPIDVLCHSLGYARKPGRHFGVVIDPWNGLNHHDPDWRSPYMSETEYVGDTLTRVTKLLRAPDNFNVHVWFVAHPAKLYRGDDGKFPMPSGYDVSGSAHWFNKADNIITIHRDKNDNAKGVDVAVQKVRFKNIGHVGVANLQYDRVTGRYSDSI